MKEELQVGNIVIVTEMYGKPLYKGQIIALTEDFAEIRELNRPQFWGSRDELVKREYVQKLI